MKQTHLQTVHLITSGKAKGMAQACQLDGLPIGGGPESTDESLQKAREITVRWQSNRDSSNA